MKLTNTFNLPETIVNTVKQWPPSVDGFSVSELINSPRIVQLTRRHFNEIEEDVSERIWALLGSAAHYLLQRRAASDSLAEERLVVAFNGIKIKGRPDLWYAHTIEDYKLTSVWTVIFTPQGRKDWHCQLNLYKWLFDTQGFETQKLRVIAILRDWNKHKVNEPDYPKIPIVVIDVPMWRPEETHLYLQNRLEAHSGAQGLADNQLPLCTAEEIWEKPTQYAIIKEGGKRAVKLCDTEELAKQNLPTGKGYYIEERVGEKVRCADYCSVQPWCNQYKAKQ